MLKSDWENLASLFHRVAEIPVGERLRYLEDQSTDPLLIDEVLALLAQDEKVESIVDNDLQLAASRLLDDPATAGTTDERFGPYRIDRLLGSGGMGIVFLGRRDDLDKVAAIKILRDAWLSPARRERFRLEQRTLAQLIHPLIAQLYDAGVTREGTPWFAMEYVDGLPITDYCRENNLQVKERLHLFQEVCLAVRFAHERAIIHRDLKPANILVTPDGHPKLLDFGIAKHIETLGDDAQQTQTEFRMMTPAFAAPEQRRGEPLGAFTDVYALGVILHVLLAGAHASKSSLPAAPPAASGLSRLNWLDLGLLCQTARHEDVQLRYSSVEALIRDLHHLLSSEPLEARPDSLIYRARKFVARNRQTLLVAGSAVTVLVLALTFFIVRLTKLKNDALHAVSRAQTMQRFTQSLFNGGEQQSVPSRDTKVSELLHRGELQADMLGQEPEAQADLYQTIGTLYDRAGDYRRAGLLLQRSLEIRKAKGVDLASALLDLGTLRTDEAKLGEAESLLRSALAIANPMERNRIKIGLGRVLKERRQGEKALPLLKEAEAELSQQPESLDLASDLKEQGEIYFYNSSYDLAETYSRRVLEMHKRLLGTGHIEVADDLVNLAAIEGNRGKGADEERDQRIALTMFENWYGPEDINTAGVLALYGKAVMFRGRYDEARPILNRALQIREKWLGPMHPLVGNTLGDICRIDFMQDKFAEAHACYRRRTDIYRTAYGDAHELVAINYLQWGDVYFSQKQYVRAEAMYRDVIGRLDRSRSTNEEQIAKAKYNLGRTYEKENRFQEAQSLLEASYRILQTKKIASEQWLQLNRKHLVQVYRALEEDGRANHMETEMKQAAREGQQ